MELPQRNNESPATTRTCRPERERRLQLAEVYVGMRHRVFQDPHLRVAARAEDLAGPERRNAVRPGNRAFALRRERRGEA